MSARPSWRQGENIWRMITVMNIRSELFTRMGLSGLMNNIEQITQAMAAMKRPEGKTYQLPVRNILCLNYLDREQIIAKYRVTNIASQRHSPNDSHYLPAIGLKDGYALDLSVSWHRP
jgi:hypothetical protein